MRTPRSRDPVHELTARLTGLREFDREALTAESIESLGEVAVRHFHELIPCRHIGVVTFDFHAGVATVVAAYSAGEGSKRGASRWPLASIEIPDELARGEVRLIDDVREGINLSPEIGFLSRESLRSHLSVPLRAKGELIGVVGLGSDHPRAFTREHVQTAVSMVEVLALAVHKARRHDRLLRHAVKLERRLGELGRTGRNRPVVLSEVVQAQEQERQRIAGDIHDDSVQVMTSAIHRLARLREELSEEGHIGMVEELEQTVSLAINRLRHLMFELVPPAMDKETISVILGSYLQRVKDETGLDVRLESRAAEEPPPQIRTILYRIAQEALTNVAKHADARRVIVTFEGREGGFLLTVGDDGRGFALRNTLDPFPGHLGLTAMRQRAEMAGGWCRVQSRPGAGTTVECWIPGERAVQVIDAGRTITLPG